MGIPIGLRDIYVAKLLTDDVSGVNYATPQKVSAAITAKITPQVNATTLYGDDQAIEQIVSLGAIQVEIGLDQLSSEQKTMFMGHSVDDNGVLLGSKDDAPPYLALAFKSIMTNGFYKHVWLYKGKFQLNEDEYGTKKDSAEPKTPTLTGVFIPRLYDGEWKAEADADNQSIPSNVFTNWLTNVYTPSVSVTMLSITTNILDDDIDVALDSDFVWTFNKIIDPATIIAGNFFVMTSVGTLASGSLSYSNDTDVTVVTFKPDSLLTASTDYVGMATTNIKDASGQALTTANIVNYTTAAS